MQPLSLNAAAADDDAAGDAQMSSFTPQLRWLLARRSYQLHTLLQRPSDAHWSLVWE